MRKNIYFGHPICTYNTSLEGILLRAIQRRFSRDTIINPNTPTHQHNCRKYNNPMHYFYAEVLPYCDKGVFLPFPDGMFGAGVFGEMRWLYNKNRKIYEISSGGHLIKLSKPPTQRKLTIEKTRQHLV